jgi:glutamyl-tRNA synthetase
MLEPDDFALRLVPYLHEAGLIEADPDARDLALLRSAAPLVQTRMALLGEAAGLLGFLFVTPEEFAVDPGDRAKFLDTDDGRRVLAAAHGALAALEPTAWTTAAIEEALRGNLIDGLGLKPRVAFGPVRVAVTGSRISPPLFESMELLGADESLRRLAAARDFTAG